MAVTRKQTTNDDLANSFIYAIASFKTPRNIVTMNGCDAGGDASGLWVLTP